MAVSAIKDFWIHPNALTITLNYFGDPQLIQTSMLAGAVIMAYRKDVISYDAAHNYREWRLQAYPTQLNDTCAYYVHAELSRGGDTAMIIYSPVKRDIEGRSFIDGAWDSTTSSSSWFIYLGEISASVDEDGVPVERAWTDGIYTGTLDTDQQRMEEASGEWKTMFALNSVTGLIDVLKTISSATINALHVAKSLIFGGKTLTDVAGTGDTLDQSKVNDATLPTTGYTKKYVGDEIAELDDHFLIKDTSSPQSVSGPVTFDQDVTVKGDHTVEGTQILHEGFRTPSYVEQGDIIQGAQVTKDGIASFAKVKTPSMQVYELTLNRKTAVQGEYVFSDGETIEEVSYQRDDDTYQLRVREPYEGYVTTFKKDDVLYSNINMLDSSAKTGKCWMLVTEVNGSTITAKMYAAAQCPSGENIAPMPHMTITRHGNRRDKTRQDLFIISSETSSLTMLRGVDAPIVSSEGLYGVVIGKLPATLLEYIQSAAPHVNGEDPYVYARGVIVQDLVMLDYQGKPIRQEVYRGHWSLETAKNDPYRNTSNLYDTVTHNGSLWQCMLAGTTVEPQDNVAEWLKVISKGEDATAIIYELKPSQNIIYRNSIGSIDVAVGETTSAGYTEITDQSVLETRRLSVYYALDGVGERHLLNISPVASYLLEDGTAVIATEDGYALTLEGDAIDIDTIEDNITLYLTDIDTDEDRAVYIIPVVKDGVSVGNNILLNSSFTEIGSDNLLKYWDEVSVGPEPIVVVNEKDLDGQYNSVYVTYGGIKQSVSLTNGSHYTLSMHIKTAQSATIVYRTLPTSDITITTKHGKVTLNETDTEKYFTIRPDIVGEKYGLFEMHIYANSYASQDTIELGSNSAGAYYACPKLERGNVATSYSKAVTELTGPAGERGKMLYPAGNYDASASYKIENNSAPFVYYNPNNEVKGTYYVLVHEGDAIKGIAPDSEGADKYWRPYTYMNYLYAEFLMANWARFGSENGAIFYDKYLFSQKGNELDYNGNIIAENVDYSGYKGDMFDEQGNLKNTKYIPNVSINFATGEVDTSRFNERYYPYSSSQVVRIGRVHNIVVTPQAGRVDSNDAALNRFGGSGPLVILPQDGLTTGAHLSIVARNDERYLTAFLQDSTTSFNILGANYLVSAFALVSVDDILANQVINDGDIGGNYIMYRGMRTKYVMLAPNYTLNLRLEIVTYLGVTYKFWHIENSNDFVKINSQIFKTDEYFGGVRIDYDNHNIYRRKYADNVGYSENWNSNQEGYAPIMVASNIFSNYNGNDSVLGRNTPDIILSTNAEGLCYGYHYRLVDGRGTSGDVNFSTFYNE